VLSSERRLPRPGDALGPLVQRVDQERMNAFAEVSGSNGKIHLDPEFSGPRYGSTLAQGMLVLDPLVQLMIGVCSAEGWMRHGRLAAKFVSYTRPGDTVTTRASVTEVEERGGLRVLTCEFRCETQDGRAVIVGTASGALLGA
jgi:3-hydroxybutyryl-CoA dehydratase